MRTTAAPARPSVAALLPNNVAATASRNVTARRSVPAKPANRAVVMALLCVIEGFCPERKAAAQLETVKTIPTHDWSLCPPGPEGGACGARRPRVSAGDVSEPPLGLHAGDVQGSGAGDAGGDDVVIEDGLDDGLPPVKADRVPFAA